MRKELKSSLLTLMILIPIALLSLGITQADPGPTQLAVDPSSIVDYAEVPGSTFHVNVTVADVSAMWGYQFNLTYDTNVLTATAYSNYDPFAFPWPSEINDAAGWVTVAYSMPFGELIGFSTVSPAPIARIDFEVDARGVTELDLHNTAISDIYGINVTHDVYDGYFRNTLLGDIDGNGSVGSSDFSILAGAYGTSVGDPLYDARADIDSNGSVGSSDFSILAGEYGQSV